MAASDDLINFDVIEASKENIQALPSGRSAKKLAEAFSPSSALTSKSTRPALQSLATPTPADTKTINDCIRAEYESEITNIAEADDPLDVYDRYVHWILDAYPSAQATPASQLHTVLERATKAFVNAPQYKNDPRYLKLWLLYISFFADSPRETFVFLARHGIGETLALFYEEYAAWLEGAARWAQAEEVYKLGIEREARPTARIVRKFGEFEQRLAAQPEDAGPSSPALPTVRPALAAKVDPFVAAERDPQAPGQTSGLGGQKPKSSKPKMQIFSDADAAPPSAMGSQESGSKGWDSIGSLADRKKENVMAPKPWAGETLQTGGKKSIGPKMSVFRDPFKSQLSKSHITIAPSHYQVTVNPANGKKERVFVDLQAVYPSPEVPGTELSFEEVWASNRGWLDQSWQRDELLGGRASKTVGGVSPTPPRTEAVQVQVLSRQNIVTLDENGRLPDQHRAGRKKKVAEVNETQIIKAKLDSPTGPKTLKKKHTSEPTMTMHTRAATDDIYDIFNAPLKRASDEADENADDDEYETDSNYTASVGESTCTTRQITTSEAGDTEEDQAARDYETLDVKSASGWSESSAGRDIPSIDRDDEEEDDDRSVLSDLINIRDADPSLAFTEHTITAPEFNDDEDEDVDTPMYDDDDDMSPPRTRTTFVPLPPEDYVAVTRTYRDPSEMANNRLPFMTPITEKTESSLKVDSDNHDRYGTNKTPSRKYGASPRGVEDYEPMSSSPLEEMIHEEFSPVKHISLPLLPKSRPALAPKTESKPAPARGPIIREAQCNPVDDEVRNKILEETQPPLSSSLGFFDHRSETYGRGGEIRKFVKACRSSRNSTDRTANLGASPVIRLPGIETEYTLKKELGAGAFAPVYLVENSSPEEAEDEEAPVAMGKGTFSLAHNQRRRLEALKMEVPPSAWEFYMMRLSHARLGPQDRATASLSCALEMHLYQDEGFLLLPFHPHGSLLDVVNIFRAESSGVMDESLAMFFTIELLRTVEALHSRQILHGDLKADNCLLRLGGEVPSAQWRADGTGGWGSRGVTLIDFGRGIDMRAFSPEVQFVADWKTTAQDCAEMREGRPWTWQIDYHGLAGIIHCLLFGKYIETVRCDTGGLGTQAGRRYRIREGLKRYWQTEIWGECFEMLLNPGSHVEDEDGARMPLLRGMKAVRERMEVWLEGNCEKGAGLRSLLGRVEAVAKARRV